MFKTELLQWDTAFFGIKVGKAVITTPLQEADIRNIKDYDLVYIFVDPSDVTSNNLLQYQNALLADERVTYLKTIDPTLSMPRDIQPYVRNESTDSEVLRLAMQSGEYSRFRIDPRISAQKFEELYSIWINKSIDRENADEVFVYMKDKMPVAFNTLSKKNDRVTMNLMAVDECERGKGIAVLLLEASEAFCVKHNYNFLALDTQKNNKTACRFYDNHGFIIESTVNIYHLWKS